MRYRPLMLGLLSAVALSLGLPSVPASAATPEEELVAKVNEYRAGKGLSALAVDESLNANGEAWASAMAASGRLAHQDIKAVRKGWELRGENVAFAATIDEMFRNLLASPPHHANIADPQYNHIGVGVITGPEGWLYAAQEFAKGAGTSRAAAAPPPPPPPATTAATSTVTEPAAAPAPAPPPAPVAPPAPAPATPPPAPPSPPPVQATPPPAAAGPKIVLPAKPRRLSDVIFLDPEAFAAAAIGG